MMCGVVEDVVHSYSIISVHVQAGMGAAATLASSMLDCFLLSCSSMPRQPAWQHRCQISPAGLSYQGQIEGTWR
jgi:hypothetical protein